MGGNSPISPHLFYPKKMKRFAIIILIGIGIISPSFSTAQPAGAPDPQLSLPWPEGEAWWLHFGPHHNSDFSSVCRSGIPTGGHQPIWPSLDFAPAPGSSKRVVAARDGWIVRELCVGTHSSSFVKIVIDHGDGWFTGYYHLTQIPEEIRTGGDRIPIKRGDLLGYASKNICCDANADANDNSTGDLSRAQCIGGASVSHVHFTVRYDADYRVNDFNKNDFTNIHNLYIGGWQVKESDCNRGGYMTRNGISVSPPRNYKYSLDPASLILNDGSVGKEISRKNIFMAQALKGGAKLFAHTRGQIILENTFEGHTYDPNIGIESPKATFLANNFQLLPGYSASPDSRITMIALSGDDIILPQRVASESHFFQNIQDVEKESSFEAIRIYPNPARQELTIDLGSNHQIQSIQQFDLSGKEIRLLESINQSPITLPLAQLGPLSQFVIVIKDDKGNIHSQIIQRIGL